MEKIQYSSDFQGSPQIIKNFIKYHQSNFQLSVNQSKAEPRGTNKSNLKCKLRYSKNDFSDEPKIRQVIRKVKTERLVRNFCNKIKMNITSSPPPKQFQNINYTQTQLQRYFRETKGLRISTYQNVLMKILSVLLTVALSIITSFILVFPQLNQQPILKSIQIVSVAFYIIETLQGLVTQNHHRGKSRIFLNQIIDYYVKNELVLSLVNILVLIIITASCVDAEIDKYLRLCILIKLWKNIQKFSALENILAQNFNMQQYWGLIGVFAINFCFAHILAILLNAMPFLNSANNWILSHGLKDVSWYQKYIWGYYWGTTIMLTVGFGDFAATTCEEALCLIFIQMFSCITLAYNINCVGNLINNLRSRSAQKNKRLKTFAIMSRHNQLSPQLQTQINNHIEGQFRIRKKFNMQQQNIFLQSLPEKLRNQYLIEANRKIIKAFEPFKSFNHKSIQCLAQRITKRITHPGQYLEKTTDIPKMIILQKGKVGFVINKAKEQNNQIIDTLESKGKQFKLLSLNFIKKKNNQYNIQSLGYSILYYLQHQDIIQALRTSNTIDFQNYCQIRDREQTQLNENEIHECPRCLKQFHNKFNCPKLHFIPIKQHVINKHRAIKFQQQRRPIKRKLDRALMKCYNPTQKFVQSFRTTHIQSKQELIIENMSTLKNLASIKQIKKIPTIESLGKKGNQYLLALVRQYLNPISQNTFWNVESDQGYDWNYYFPKDNPSNLKQKSKKTRKNKLNNP